MVIKSRRIITLLLALAMGLGLCGGLAYAADDPSPWAAEEVNRAIAQGLVPQKLQTHYRQPVTRAEFCALAVALYETVTGWAIIGRVGLADTSDVNIEKMAAVGVVDSAGPARFSPGSNLTREQAATMLTRLMGAIGRPLPKQDTAFTDNSSISGTAYEAVGQMQRAGIMNGTGTDGFSPKKPYTREQGILTILRAFDIVKDVSGFDASKAIPFASLAEYYDLTEGERRLYDQISAGVANFDLRIEVDSVPQDGKGSDMLCRACDIVYCTHPELFWWDGKVRYPANRKPSEDGKHYLLPVYIVDGKELRSEVSGSKNTIVCPPASEVAEGKAWVERGMADIREKLSNLPARGGASPYELELAAYDWLGDNLTYDGSDFAKHEFNTIHGALVDGRVDCNGYSRAFQYIMCLLGIESVVLNGKNSSGEQHMWSAVKLDGEWYQADVTVDCDLRKSEGLPWHYWLNRNDEFRTGKGVTIITDRASITSPDISCTATKYNYYVMTDAHIASDSDFISKVPARIAIARAGGERAFDIEFAPSYAPASEIYDKLEMLDPSLLEDIKFYHNKLGVVFAVFRV